MRKVIKGKTYDTETAELIGWYKKSSTIYRRVKARDYFMTFFTDSDVRPLTDNEAWKVMHSGEFVYDE